MQEMLGRLFIDTSKREEAQNVFNDLIESNPDNYEYHDGLIEVMLFSLSLSLSLSTIPAHRRQKRKGRDGHCFSICSSWWWR